VRILYLFLLPLWLYPYCAVKFVIICYQHLYMIHFLCFYYLHMHNYGCQEWKKERIITKYMLTSSYHMSES
jgi:hypothetical protein